ncbi:unnamed protein product [Urochloa humidicola]
MAAATFSAAGRRLLSTAAATAEKTELPVPIAQLRRLARAGRLDDIDAALAPLIRSHTAAALSALSSVGLPDRASVLLGTVPSPTAAHLNAVVGPLLRRRRLAALLAWCRPSSRRTPPSRGDLGACGSLLASGPLLTSGSLLAAEIWGPAAAGERDRRRRGRASAGRRRRGGAAPSGREEVAAGGEGRRVRFLRELLETDVRQTPECLSYFAFCCWSQS